MLSVPDLCSGILRSSGDSQNAQEKWSSYLIENSGIS